MRILLALLISCATSVALANPFDAFIGKYELAGKTKIEDVNAKWCNRFGFKDLVGLEIVADGGGGHQTHIIYFRRISGWSGEPITEFNYKSEFGNGGSYGKTTGSSDSAMNTYVSYSNTKSENLTMKLQKTSAGVLFEMDEELYENSKLSAACYYEVKLIRK